MDHFQSHGWNESWVQLTMMPSRRSAPEAVGWREIPSDMPRMPSRQCRPWHCSRKIRSRDLFVYCASISTYTYIHTYLCTCTENPIILIRIIMQTYAYVETIAKRTCVYVLCKHAKTCLESVGELNMLITPESAWQNCGSQQEGLHLTVIHTNTTIVESLKDAARCRSCNPRVSDDADLDHADNHWNKTCYS